MNACHFPSKSLVGTPSETPATIPLYLGCVTYGRGAGLQKLAGRAVSGNSRIQLKRKLGKGSLFT